ncbi:MAG: hypothetical protein GX082_03835 [Clostridiaceae bacterium]|jgi:hypothetical protein|nr:hypothetical protein [Clostridiaceae bacterium]
MKQIKSELMILGINPILILAFLVVVFTLIAIFAGEMLNLSLIGFEVIFPFIAAIFIGEWGKIKADDNYDMIAAQGKSLISWVLYRSVTVFATVTFFVVLCMAIVFHIRSEIPLQEMILIYLSPAFMLSTLTVLCNLIFTHEHVSTLVCGMIWLLAMLSKSMLRYPMTEYIYLFIRYSGDRNGIWLINKSVIIAICAVIWTGICLVYGKKNR